MIMLAGGPLAAAYFISSGCGVRLFILGIRSSGTSNGNIRKRLHTFVFIDLLWSRAQQHQTVEILEAKPNYSTPKVKVLSFIPRDLIATSPLEDPEKGDDYDW